MRVFAETSSVAQAWYDWQRAKGGQAPPSVRVPELRHRQVRDPQEGEVDAEVLTVVVRPFGRMRKALPNGSKSRLKVSACSKGF